MPKGWFVKPDTMRKDHSNGAWRWNNIQTVKGQIFDIAFQHGHLVNGIENISPRASY